ncbi:hypothetical protein H6P81_009017 [Aristolochia fimbriata]|uniref:Uncharacterized protein n=1 Tax=Aristolochia fimbriata TaxID=158543 RepID=A0AAV7EN51_ARIFI|nr:hypothetical protein H6P81_009017 [Aristolochia fimbriata]
MPHSHAPACRQQIRGPNPRVLQRGALGSALLSQRVRVGPTRVPCGPPSMRAVQSKYEPIFDIPKNRIFSHFHGRTHELCNGFPHFLKADLKSDQELSTDGTRAKPTESYSMNRGDGPTSYFHNSQYQRECVDVSNVLISEAIANNITLEELSSISTFHIADLGCSVGPNTFSVVQNIIAALEHKLLQYPSDHHHEVPVLDFQVSFNDHSSNDFNTLFSSLPSKGGRRYFAAGVPGSFHGRLFPKASLNFVHSSCALHWLSQVPNDVKDETSPAWNKGKIFSVEAKQEVQEAFSAQFAKDMEVFLKARADEVAAGGLMSLTLPYTKDPVYVEKALSYRVFRILELALNDMADKGRLDEGKVNSFNLPMYFPYAQEIKKLVKQNGSFTIEKMQPLTSTATVCSSRFDARECSMVVRAVLEGIIAQYFGSETVDEIFEKYVEMAEEKRDFMAQSTVLTDETLFVLLKRKDLGCSVGPNTFSVVQNIIGALEHKLLQCYPSSQVVLDFQVSFNDHATNDFNNLFSSLKFLPKAADDISQPEFPGLSMAVYSQRLLFISSTPPMRCTGSPRCLTRSKMNPLLHGRSAAWGLN